MQSGIQIRNVWSHYEYVFFSKKVNPKHDGRHNDLFFVIFSLILSSWKPASLRFSSNAGHSNSMCLIPFWICIPSRREKLKNKSICEFRSIFYLYEVLGKSWRRTSLVWELVGWVSKHKHQSSLHILKAKYEDIRIMHRKNMRQHFWVSGLSLG